MQAVAVGWQVYDITKRALDLGLVGLAQFLPGILLFLVSGHASDRFDRRKVLGTCYAGYAVCSGLLLVLAMRGTHAVLPIYLVLILAGHRALIQRNREPLDFAAIGSRRTFLQCSGVECHDFSGCDDYRALARRHPVRRVSRTISRLWDCYGYCHGRIRFRLPHQNADSKRAGVNP